MSKTLIKDVTRNDYLKLYIDSRVGYFSKKLKEWLNNGILQVNSYVNSKFDFILPYEDLSKNQCVKYASGITPTDD